MTGPQLVAICWGVFAVSMGYVFARYPEQLEAVYRDRMDHLPTTSRLRKRRAPTTWTIGLCRVGGVFFIAVGVVVGSLGAAGILN